MNRSVPRVSVFFGLFGFLAIVLSLAIAYQNLVGFSSPGNADNSGLVVIFIVPIATVGGIFLAHGIYRLSSPEEREYWWLLVYPLAAAGGMGIVGAFMKMVVPLFTYSQYFQLVAISSVPGIAIAALVWVIDIFRSNLS